MALNSSELKTYHKLMNNINSGLLIIDITNKICACNNWFSEHCENNIQDIVSANLYALFPEIKDSRINDAIDSTFELGYPAVVSNIFTPTPFPLYPPKNFERARINNLRIQQQVTISRLEENGDFYCLIQINDVTASVLRERTLELEVAERKQIEDALLESEIKHLTIMETMVDGLIVFNANGQIESFNPACEILFGITEAEAVGTCVSYLFMGLIDGDDRKCSTDLRLNQRFIGSYNEIKAIKNTNEVFDVELSISDMQISGKIFYAAIIRDITERKNIEKMKTEFISTVSHELRTPLTSIRGSLGLLCGGAVDTGTDQGKDLINIAFNNSDRLVLLINDILDMEKIAADGLAFDIKPHDLFPLLARSIEENLSYAEQYKVIYQLDKNDTNYCSDIDAHRFLQIMTNLLSNAAKFSHANDKIDIRIYSKNGQNIIEVQDYGEGIPDAFKENIWNNFTQADASTTRRKGGTGLGLAISRSLVHSMNGLIEFNSKQGEGTTFLVSFPVSKGHS